MKKSFVISTMVATLLFGASVLEANSSQASINKEVSVQNAMTKSTPKEIVIGFQDTYKALQALQQNDKSAAKKALTEATKMFEKGLKADPSLKLLPVATQMQVAEIDASVEEIKDALKMAQEALEKHRLEDARVILAHLQDILIVNTQYLPTDIYPLSTKNALKALEDDKPKEALEILMTGFSAMVSDTVLIPIPLLTAQDMISQASSLDKSKKKEALALLDGAKMELQKAELLGYTNDDSPVYTALMDQIESLQKEIKGKNIVAKLYDKLKSDFKALIHKTRNNSYKDSVAAKEAKALLHPSVPGEAAAQDKLLRTRAQDLLEAKEKAQTFAKEATADKDKTLQQKSDSGLKDSVSKEESSALKHPSDVKGEAAAKAKVEEAASKELFKTKEAASTFAKDAKDETKKVLK